MWISVTRGTGSTVTRQTKRISQLVLATVVLVLLTSCKNNRYPPDEWSGSVCGLNGSPRFEHANAPAASKLLRETLRKDNGTGIAAAVIVNGELIWSDAAGRSGNHSSPDLTPFASMRLGSVSKPMTAALIARLADLSLLDLDSPIQQYVADFPEKNGTVTLRHLLTHTSGIRHYNFSSFSESNSRVQYQNLSESLFLFSEDPLLFPPGEQYAYSSFGYNLTGAAIENALGISFGEALQEYLVQPMMLERTHVDNPAAFVPCRPAFYTVTFARVPISTIWRNHSDAYPSAGILASAEDLGRFAYTYFRGDYLAAETRDYFMTPVTLNDGQVLRQSPGWELGFDENGDIDWYGHGGTTNGAYASLRYYPDSNMIIAGISNYNFWLTGKSPEFFQLIREELPSLFAL